MMIKYDGGKRAIECRYEKPDVLILIYKDLRNYKKSIKKFREGIIGLGITKKEARILVRCINGALK